MGNTIQRQKILDIINKSNEHLSVEEIYEKVIFDIPNISLGTVYRNLDILVDKNMIRAIYILNQPVRYDNNLEYHDHLVCKKCFEVKDIPLVELDYSKIDDINQEIESHTLLLHYTCDKCKTKN